MAQVRQAVGPVEIIREDQVKQVVVRGDAAGVSVGQDLGELQSALGALDRPVGYEFAYGGQAQMMVDMKRTLLTILGFALFFSFILLTVQFNSLKLPALILGSVPFCVAGVVHLLGAAGIPLGATVIIGVLVVVAAAVNEGVLLMTYAEEIRQRDQLPPAVAVAQAARIRFRPRVMTSLGVLVGFLPLALNLEEGGDMLQPMAAAGIGGLLTTIVVALFLMPVLYAMCGRPGRAPRVAPTQSSSS